jgi:hypothetical protein
MLEELLLRPLFRFVLLFPHCIDKAAHAF